MTDLSPPPDAERSEISLAEIFAIFWRGRWIILGSVLLASVLGALYVHKRGTVWRARSELTVERDGSMIVDGPSLFLGGESRNFSNTQAARVKSRPVLVAAIQQLEQVGLPLEEDYPGDDVFGDAENKPAWLSQNLNVSVGRDNDIITVALDSKLRFQAYAVVNAVVDAFASTHSSRKEETASEAIHRLIQGQEKLQEDLEAKWLRQVELQEGKDVPEIAGAGRLEDVSSELAALRSELRHALADAKEAEETWGRAADLADNHLEYLRAALPALLGQRSFTIPPPDPTITARLRELEEERVGVLIHLTAETPRVKENARQIEELRGRQLDQDRIVAETVVATLRGRFEFSKSQAEDLQRQLTDKQAVFDALKMRDVDLAILTSKIERAEKDLDLIGDRIRAITINDVEGGSSSVDILNHASESNVLVASGKATTLAIVVFLGFLLGCGLAWLRGMLDQRIRTAQDATDATQLPVLSIVPRADFSKAQEAEDAVGRWEADRKIAEAARSLRTAVYFGTADEEARLIQITSPDSGDGKSVTASNLAIAMAKAGQRTLLLDADLRRPRQAKMFRCDNEVGLSNILATEVTVSDARQRTGVENLDLLPSGPVPPNPAEMLNSRRMADLLGRLAELYDRVIVDSPPVLPVADARIIATKCQVSILVLRVDRSTRKRAAAARDDLRAVGANVLGAVVNDMPTGIGYGYGYGYGYYGRSYVYDEDGGGGRRRVAKSSRSEAAAGSVS